MLTNNQTQKLSKDTKCQKSQMFDKMELIYYQFFHIQQHIRKTLLQVPALFCFTVE